MSKIMMHAGDVVQTEGRTYELVGILGRGGMGEVWEALDLRRGGYVAIKFMLEGRSDTFRRFRLEGKVLQSLAHQNIVKFIDVGETENKKPFLVLERLYGQTVREKLDKCGKFSPREAIKVAHAIAEALKAAHDLGIVHRDLKPSNVFIQDEPGTRRRSSDVKLIDFGIAKDTRTQTHTHATAPGTRIGSLCYMSPEQISGAPVDHRADLWSLGALMYEMIQGEALFVAPSSHISQAVLHDPIHPIPWCRLRVPESIDAIIRQCLQRDLTRRVCSADEVEKQLRRLLHAPDEELEIVCIQINDEIETVDAPRQNAKSLPVVNNQDVSKTIQRGFEVITRQSIENHQQLMRSIRIFGTSGLVLIGALIALISWLSIVIPLKDRTAVRHEYGSPSREASPKVDENRAKIQSVPISPSLPHQSRQHVSGCRY